MSDERTYDMRHAQTFAPPMKTDDGGALRQYAPFTGGRNIPSPEACGLADLGPVELPHDFKRRLGEFSIDRQLLEDCPDLLVRALRSMLVVRCELRFDSGAFHYVAMSAQFEPIAAGFLAPQYDVVVTNAKDGSVEKIEFARQ